MAKISKYRFYAGNRGQWWKMYEGTRYLLCIGGMMEQLK